MKQPLLLGIFNREEDVLSAAEATRKAGYEIYDVYTPYAVHGLDKVMGLRPSRLTFVCFAFAALGLLFAVAAQYWIGAIDWPLNVGGRPFNSLPAYLPVAFEMTVLLGGLGVVFVMFGRIKLFPGKKPQLLHNSVTDNQFVLAVLINDASMEEEQFKEFWRRFCVDEVKVMESTG